LSKVNTERFSYTPETKERLVTAMMSHQPHIAPHGESAKRWASTISDARYNNENTARAYWMKIKIEFEKEEKLRTESGSGGERTQFWQNVSTMIREENDDAAGKAAKSDELASADFFV
jgi:hypothetical protein